MSKNLTDFPFKSFLHLSALAVSFCRNTNSTQQVYCLFPHVILKNKLRKRLALTSLKWKQNSWNVPYVTPSSRHVIFLVKCIDMKLFPEVPSKTHRFTWSNILQKCSCLKCSKVSQQLLLVIMNHICKKEIGFTL